MGILNNAHGLLIYIDSSEDFISVYIFLEDMNILTHYIWITIAGGIYPTYQGLPSGNLPSGNLT